nr:uncharacterized protein LOC112935000 [Vulpes vulpes]
MDRDPYDAGAVYGVEQYKPVRRAKGEGPVDRLQRMRGIEQPPLCGQDHGYPGCSVSVCGGEGGVRGDQDWWIHLVSSPKKNKFLLILVLKNSPNLFHGTCGTTLALCLGTRAGERRPPPTTETTSCSRDHGIRYLTVFDCGLQEPHTVTKYNPGAHKHLALSKMYLMRMIPVILPKGSISHNSTKNPDTILKRQKRRMQIPQRLSMSYLKRRTIY